MSKKNLRHVPVLSNWLRFFIINQDIDMVYLITTAVTDSDGNEGFFTLKPNSHFSAWQYSAKQLKMMENRA